MARHLNAARRHSSGDRSGRIADAVSGSGTELAASGRAPERPSDELRERGLVTRKPSDPPGRGEAGVASFLAFVRVPGPRRHGPTATPARSGKCSKTRLPDPSTAPVSRYRAAGS